MNLALGQERYSKLNIYNMTMSNLLKILCFALSLFYVSTVSLHAAQSRKRFDQLLDAVKNLTSPNNTIKCPLVPVIGDTKNSTVAEISCRALQSLKACNETNHNLFLLKKSLAYFQKETKCSTPQDTQEDIYSFLKALYRYFQRQNVNP